MDDPANPAQLGQWRTESVITNVGLGNRNFTRAAYAAAGGAEELARLEADETFACVEPSLATPNTAISQFETQYGDCTALPDSAAGAIAIRCVAPTRTATIRLSGPIGERDAQIEMQMDVENQQAGRTTRAMMRVRQSWERLGDCA